MLKKHKNQIARVLKSACDKHQLDFRNFTFQSEEDTNTYAIKDKLNDLYYFEARNHAKQYLYVIYKPGENEIKVSTLAANLEETFPSIEEWISALAYEKNEPDLWKELSQLQTTSALDTTNNDPLNQEQQAKALQILENIKAYVLENGNQMQDLEERLNTRFDYVEKAVTRLGRKDLIVIIMGAVLSVVMSQMLSSEDIAPFLSFAMEQIQLLSDTNISALTNSVSP